jgi:DNA-binding MarR family transcriptional regulator
MVTSCQMARPHHDRKTAKAPLRGAASPAFLLTQVGSHAAAAFTRRLKPTGLTPPHAGVLRAIAASEGQSQQALSRALSVVPSKLVQLLDELENRGLVERRNHPRDRRTYALHLTRKGREMLDEIGRVAREHQNALFAALSELERGHLASLLLRVVRQQGLVFGVHPGFRRLGRKQGGRG